MGIHHAGSNSELVYKCRCGTASSVSIKNDEEHCELVQMHAIVIVPILSMSFSISTNLTVINKQVWTALASALYIYGQQRGKDTGNTGTSHPTLS
jgi:hypothetical protein